jgi:hypothetical protein
LSDPTGAGERCPGLWIERLDGSGYCELEDECRNPHAEAHDRFGFEDMEPGEV